MVVIEHISARLLIVCILISGGIRPLVEEARMALQREKAAKGDRCRESQM